MNKNITPILLPPEFKCSLCGGPLHGLPDDGVNMKAGVTVICLNPAPCIPTCNENVYGHGENPKEAYEILKQKFRKDT
jgi:hypothetical protein